MRLACCAAIYWSVSIYSLIQHITRANNGPPVPNICLHMHSMASALNVLCTCVAVLASSLIWHNDDDDAHQQLPEPQHLPSCCCTDSTATVSTKGRRASKKRACLSIHGRKSKQCKSRTSQPQTKKFPKRMLHIFDNFKRTILRLVGQQYW